ncbi:hypothetical protein [Streptomyces sp. NEAU-YJ-81]|uniref:hypothetical protein n=1 Tax=Streptomyces sp. NEAU-YJ-81 TaxID=2820288 RepID=UPI001ABD2C9C|nr:hypothetical protein [Streptomyces sp. NEAU-YJ-81]MBO3682549.1 hypothetical protein [Streptomyces sp. NEAU-YJ-81]
MAADVAYWHRRNGGGLLPDTCIRAELPLPREVLPGENGCPRSLTEKIPADRKALAMKGTVTWR